MFSKPLFTWKEPKAFKLAHTEFERSGMKWWRQPLVACIFASVVLLKWWTVWVTGGNPPSFVLVLAGALAAGALVGWGRPWLASVSASTICLTEKRVGVARGDGFSRDYSGFSAFEWRENSGFATLVLCREEGLPALVIGVPLDVSRAAVSEFLASRGIPNLGAGEEPRALKSKTTSFRAELLFCVLTACVFAAPIVWFCTNLRWLLGKVGLHETDFGRFAQLCLVAHIWVPIFLALTVAFVARIKIRNPKTIWPRPITGLVGITLLFVVITGLREPLQRFKSKADSNQKETPDALPYPQ